MPRKAEFIFPPKRCEWPILSSLTIREAFFEVPLYNRLGSSHGLRLGVGRSSEKARQSERKGVANDGQQP